MPINSPLEKLQVEAHSIAKVNPQTVDVGKYLECYCRLLHDEESWKSARTWLNDRIAITRSEMKSFAEDCKNELKSWSTLFIISMLWGYGENDKAGPVKTYFAIKSNGAREIIESTAELVRNGNLKDAFITIRKLDEVGRAYGTKFLFAVGQAYQLEPQPLVLDSNLEKALRNWWGKDQAESRFALKDQGGSSKSMRRAAEGYVTYCYDIHDIAMRLRPQSTPDCVEQFLFENSEPAESKSNK